MKRFYHYLLAGVMGAGFLMMGCGAPVFPIDASEGGASSITITWDEWEYAGSGPFDVLRSTDPETDPSGWTACATGETGTSFVDDAANGAAANMVYFYAIKAGSHISGYDGGYHGATSDNAVDIDAWRDSSAAMQAVFMAEHQAAILAGGGPPFSETSDCPGGGSIGITTAAAGDVFTITNTFDECYDTPGASTGYKLDGTISGLITGTFSGYSRGVITFDNLDGGNGGKSQINYVLDKQNYVEGSHTYTTTGGWTDTEYEVPDL